MADFHTLPGDTPDVENTLRQGEIITAVTLPPPAKGKQVYRKIRDRASYAFALVSVAAIVEAKHGQISSVTMAFGGLAHKPWRNSEAERQFANGRDLSSSANAYSDHLLADARGYGDNDFKIPLTRRAITAVLRHAMEA